MNAAQPPTAAPSAPWAGTLLLVVLWIGAIAVVVAWWEPAGPRYDVTVTVRGVPAAAHTDPQWLAQTEHSLTSNRSLLRAAESLAGREPAPTAAELAAFRDALQLRVRPDAVSPTGALELHYVGALSQAPALVQALAGRFAASQPSSARAQVKLAVATAAPGGFRAWGVGLLIVLAVCTGGWCLAWWGRTDRPLAGARQTQALLGLPVLAVDWRG